MKLKIKKGDSVKVITGFGKGYTGEVMSVDTQRLRVKVAGHNMMTNYDKEKGITQSEGYVDYSNVQLASPAKRTKKKKKASKKA